MRRSEPFSALRSTALQNQPAILSCHSRTEAMRFCASPVIGLEGPFGHMIAISPFKRNDKTKRQLVLCQETMRPSARFNLLWVIGGCSAVSFTPKLFTDPRLRFECLRHTKPGQVPGIALVRFTQVGIGTRLCIITHSREPVQPEPLTKRRSKTILLQGVNKNSIKRKGLRRFTCVLCRTSLDKMIGSVLVSRPRIQVFS